MTAAYLLAWGFLDLWGDNLWSFVLGLCSLSALVVRSTFCRIFGVLGLAGAFVGGIYERDGNDRFYDLFPQTSIVKKQRKD